MPVPTNLAGYYPESYHFVPKSSEYLEEGSKPENYKIEIVKEFVNHGRLLEIGPAYGSFTYLAKKAGFEVDAIEMNTRCCEFLNKVVGVNAINSDDPIAALGQSDPYDVIALWHVIEHLPDPWPTLDTICANLKPGGIVVLASPNPGSFQFNIMGCRWPHVDAPRHLMLIPMKLLAEKLESLGMKAELITTTDQGSVGWNTFGWKFFFANLSSQLYIKKVLSLTGQLVSLLFSPIEKIEGKGSAYTMVFRKDYK
ncbi:MAG: class I SAM-dependent methyltransferase [Nitrosomonadales bacterium]|nr:MAG: class I SAM-dependent methyltransferase [Nitrosomonadales bacterium]